MDNQRSEKIMEEYREEVSDLRRQSYPKMSLNEAVKIASEYMLNHYSKEELKEAIINDKQMQLFGMEKSWLNALGKAKKMAKGSTIKGGGLGDEIRKFVIPYLKDEHNIEVEKSLNNGFNWFIPANYDELPDDFDDLSEKEQQRFGTHLATDKELINFARELDYITDEEVFGEYAKGSTIKGEKEYVVYGSVSSDENYQNFSKIVTANDEDEAIEKVVEWADIEYEYLWDVPQIELEFDLEARERMAKGSTVKGNYFSELEANFSSTRRGGVKNYSVDIDLENGEQLRGGDLDFKDGNDALFLYERVKQKGEYQHEKIEDIQLIVNFKNGDYETVDIPTYADGGYVEGGSADLSTKEKATMYVWIDSFLEKYSGDDNFSQSLDMYKEFAKKFKKNKEQTHDIIDSGWARSRGYYEKAQAIKKSANRYANGGNTTSGYNYSIGGL